MDHWKAPKGGRRLSNPRPLPWEGDGKCGWFVSAAGNSRPEDSRCSHDVAEKCALLASGGTARTQLNWVIRRRRCGTASAGCPASPE
jgi:hypothetical protein